MDPEHRKQVVDALVSQADGYYTVLISTATLFLSGTVVFADRISPDPTRTSVILLSGGWFSLILCICVVVYVRYSNVQAGTLVLMEQHERAKPVESRSRTCTALSGLLLALGMLCVAAASLVGLWSKVTMSSPTTSDTKSIPFTEIAKPSTPPLPQKPAEGAGSTPSPSK